jgi:Tripartite tricarboxylate transporter TctB family
MHLKNPKDFWSGVMFAVIGFAFSYGVKYYEYRMGSSMIIGPGFFPFWLGLILGSIGVFILLRSLATVGEPISKFAWRPLLWILFSIVLFAMTAKILGLPIAIFIMVAIATFGGDKFHVREVILSGIVLAVFCTLAFVTGLGLSFPIWPDWDGARQIFPFLFK